jgi:hypothetical protein
MNQDYTDYTLIIDKSVSMAPRSKETVAGINKYASEQAALPGTSKFTLIQFAGPGNYFASYTGVDGKDIPTLVEVDKHEGFGYHRRGPLVVPDSKQAPTYSADGSSTAIVDAVCRAIDELGQRLANMREEDRPARVFVVIDTDGEENASQLRKIDMSNRIKHQTENYNWQFIYLGANQDAIKEGTGYGISAGKSLTTAMTSKGREAAYESASKLSSRMRGGPICAMSTMDYLEEDREVQKKELEAEKKYTGMTMTVNQP